MDEFNSVEYKLKKQIEGKRNWSLLPWGAVERVVLLREMARPKYPDHNSFREIAIKHCVDAIQRHNMAIRRGEMIDPEFGLLHADHLACEAMFLSEILSGDPALPDLEQFRGQFGPSGQPWVQKEGE